MQNFHFLHGKKKIRPQIQNQPRKRKFLKKIKEQKKTQVSPMKCMPESEIRPSQKKPRPGWAVKTGGSRF